MKVSRNGLEISHVLFVDGLILFSHATTKDAKELIRCLDKFYSWYGKKVNGFKSTVYFSKNTPRTKATVVNVILDY